MLPSAIAAAESYLSYQGCRGAPVDALWPQVAQALGVSASPQNGHRDAGDASQGGHDQSGEQITSAGLGDAGASTSKAAAGDASHTLQHAGNGAGEASEAGAPASEQHEMSGNVTTLAEGDAAETQQGHLPGALKQQLWEHMLANQSTYGLFCPAAVPELTVQASTHVDGVLVNLTRHRCFALCSRNVRKDVR